MMVYIDFYPDAWITGMSMKTTEILVRLKTAIFALTEAEKEAAEGASDHAERIGEVRFLLEALYAEIKKSE